MPSNRRLRLGLATAGVTALALTGIAYADFEQIGDGTKTRGPLDILSASQGHASSTKLLHGVVTQSHIPRSRRSTICLRIYFQKPRSSADIGDFERLICANGRDTETHIQDTTRPGRTTGFVRVLRDDNSRAFRFRASSAVGNRSKYYWAVDTFYRASRGPCGTRLGCTDSAPNGFKTVRHSLR